MFKQLALAGAIVLSFTSCLSKTNNSISVSEIHQKVNGTYLVHGTCYNRDGYISISDNTGSLSGRGNVNCYGTYGAARVRKQGTNTQIVKFNPIRKVGKTYRILEHKSKSYVVIDKDGTPTTVKVSGRGFTPFVVEINGSEYERL